MIGKPEPMLYTITGPMYSAKTTKLLSEIEKYSYAECKSILFKPIIDNRYSETHIMNHNGFGMMCVPLQNSSEIRQYINDMEEEPDIIGIDEITFFDSRIVDLCDRLRRNGKVVYASGLDMDYKRKPFIFTDGEKDIGSLLAISDLVDKRTAVCQENIDGRVCGAVARYTKRIIESDNFIEIGSDGMYIATCLEHHEIL